MSRYATNTDVSTERSQAEMKRTIHRYGAGKFFAADDWDNGRAVIGFVLDGVSVQIVLELPHQNAEAFTLTETGRDRKPAAALKAWEQGCRQRWRALNLVVKAKLEAVESGITTFEQEFMSFLVLPGGKTLGERLLPQIREGIATGKMPKLLPLLGEGS